jgi:hypothetical protein
MKKTLLSFLLISSIILGYSNLAFSKSEADEIQDIARDIDSIETAKSFLRSNIRCPDPTGCSGYGMWIRAVQVCKIVKAVNLKVGGKVIPGSSGSKKRAIPISKLDLNLMKMVHSQCKQQRYIDSASNPVETVFRPSRQINKKVDQVLF